MSPITHFLASWIVAAPTTDNPRDCRLVTLAGVAPDLDGLGVLIDMANGNAARGEYLNFDKYHHWLNHGLPGALVCSLVLAAFGKRRLRTLVLCFLVFHLHLLCDLAGSRGPRPHDFWPIYYFGPIKSIPMWVWPHQWALNAWPNQLITLVLLIVALWMAVRRGDSVVGVFSRRADRIFVEVLRKWCAQLGLAGKFGLTAR